MSGVQPMVPADGYPPLFWDLSSCPHWYTPIAMFYRSRSRLLCWLRSRHEPVVGHLRYMGDGGPWWNTCKCGYFGAALTEGEKK